MRWSRKILPGSIYTLWTKASKSLVSGLDRVANRRYNQCDSRIPIPFCTLPIDDPLENIATFNLRGLFRCAIIPKVFCPNKGANLQLRSLLVLLLRPDDCPNIFLFKTSAAPSGRAWLLYCEYPVESASEYCRVFLFLLLNVPKRAESNPE